MLTEFTFLLSHALNHQNLERTKSGDDWERIENAMVIDDVLHCSGCMRAFVYGDPIFACSTCGTPTLCSDCSKCVTCQIDASSTF